MHLAPTPLQTELRAQARSVLERGEEPTWAMLAELGWTGASLPASAGGAGLTFLEEAVLHEEAGRALLHGPLWSTAALAPFLPEPDQQAVAAGAESWVLAATPLVPDLDTATRVAVVGGDTIWELVGASREVLATVDASRPLGVVVGGEAARPLCSSEVLPEIRARTLVLLACEAVGVTSRALELAVAHAREREQFGRAIGAFQAVAHPLADVYVELELARSLTSWAAWCVAEAEAPRTVAAAAAKAQAAEAAVFACERAIQTLGGLGFTWESPLNGLYRRALWIETWEASGERLRAEVAAHLLDGGEAV
ncbi:MAG: acyl-CoA dehydrogenase family protein [Gaiella sp.]